MNEAVKGLDLPETVTPKFINFDHLRSLCHLYREKGINGFTEPIDFSEKWLSKKFEELRSLRERAFEFVDNYEYGLVYAVKVLANDPCRMRGNSEIIADPVLPPERILAKAIIPKDFIFRVFFTDQFNRQRFKAFK